MKIHAKKTYLYDTDETMLDELAESLGISQSAAIRLSIRNLYHLHQQDPFAAQTIAQELREKYPDESL
jgi:hypothetical protein